MAKSFEQYLRENVEAGRIDFSLRVVPMGAARIRFYLHPTNANGDTPEYLVRGGALLPIPSIGYQNQLEADVAHAETVLTDAIAVLRGIVHGGGLPGDVARQISLSLTNAEQSKLWLKAATSTEFRV